MIFPKKPPQKELLRHLFSPFGKGVYSPQYAGGKQFINDKTGNDDRMPSTGYALNFDGILGSYALFDDTLLDDTPTKPNELTISVWLNADTFSGGGGRCFLSFQADKGNVGTRLAFDNNNLLLFSQGGDSIPVATLGLSVNQWFHLLIETDNSTFTHIYVDNVLKFTSNTPIGHQISSKDATLGACWIGGIAQNVFQGSIYDVRIWQSLLDSEQKSKVNKYEILGNELFHAKLEEGHAFLAYESVNSTIAEFGGSASFSTHTLHSFRNKEGYSVETTYYKQFDSLNGVINGPYTADLEMSNQAEEEAYLIARRTNNDLFAGFVITDNIGIKLHHTYKVRLLIRVNTTDTAQRFFAMSIGTSTLFVPITPPAIKAPGVGWELIEREITITQMYNSGFDTEMVLTRTSFQIGDELHVKWYEITPLTAIPKSNMGFLDVFTNSLTFMNKVAYNAIVQDLHCLSTNGIDENCVLTWPISLTPTSIGDKVQVSFYFKHTDNDVPDSYLLSSSVSGVPFIGTGSGAYPYLYVLFVPAIVKVGTLGNGLIGVQSARNFGDGEWHYMDIEIEKVSNIENEDLNLKLKVDGVLEMDSTGYLIPTLDTVDSFMGFDNGLVVSNPVNGAICGFKVSLNNQSIAEYPFSEGNGATAHDISGNGNHATLVSNDLSNTTGVWSQSQDVFAQNLSKGYNLVSGVNIPLVSPSVDALGNSNVSHPTLPNHLNNFEGSVNLDTNSNGESIPALENSNSNYIIGGVISPATNQDFIDSSTPNHEVNLIQYPKELTDNELKSANNFTQ